MYQFDSDEWWNSRNTAIPQTPATAAPVAPAPAANPFGFVGGLDTGTPTGPFATPAQLAAGASATPMPKPGMEATPMAKPEMYQAPTSGGSSGLPQGFQNLPTNASYYRVPVTFEGKTWDVTLDNAKWNLLLKDVANGKNFNDVALQSSGDGIGSGGITPGSGYGQYGVDVGSGSMIGAGVGGGMGGGGGGGGYGSGLNPFLTSAQQALTSQITDNLRRNILPGLSSAAIASGNFGGSRQGVIEANALNDANRQIANGMANLSFNAFESDANRGLQQQQINNSYDLGLGNLNNSFYTAQRGQDLQATALGAQLMNMGNANYLGAGSGIANLGTSQQQAPWQVIGNMNNSISPFTGFGSTTSSQNSNPWASALGGAIGLGQIGKLL